MKLMRSLFQRYANTGHKVVGGFDKGHFDDIKNLSLFISCGELITLLKDHNLVPSVISKEAVVHLVKLVN